MRQKVFSFQSSVFSSVILSAAKNLTKFSSQLREGCEALRCAQGDSSWRAMVVVAALLLSILPARADVYDALIKQLGSTNEETRIAAAGRIADLGGPRAVEQFRKMITAGSPERRQMAAVGLLQVSDDAEDVERIHGLLKDEAYLVRWSAALSLGQSGHREALPWLEEVAQSDKSAEVREVAAAAVKQLQASIDWVPTVPVALRKAKELKKPVLAYFYVRGSEYCQKFAEGVLADKEVADAAQEFVCVRVEAAGQPDVARKFDVRGAPTVLILDGQGNEMERVAGLVEKEKFLAKLAATRAGKLTFREAKRMAAQNPGDVPANWKVAETYLEEGRMDLAEPNLRNVVDHDAANKYGHTDNALFALGMSLGQRGQHAQAVFCLEKLLEKWPEFKHKDKALYCLGLSRLATGKKDEGRAALEQLVKEFPESSAVGSAQQALDKLGGK